MGFELYPYDRTCATNRPRRGLEVALSRHGQLILSANAYAALGTPEHVCPLYDPTERVIGVRASTDPHALRVSQRHRSTRIHSVSINGFRAYFGLEACTVPWRPAVMRAGMLCVSLDQRPLPLTGHDGPDDEAIAVHEGSIPPHRGMPVTRPIP